VPLTSPLARRRFRRRAILVTAIVLAAWASSACRITRPPAVDGGMAAAPAPDAETAPTPHLRPYLVLRLSERRLYLVDDVPGTPDESFPIAVGREGLETPVGRFHVEEMVKNPDFLQMASGVVVKRIPPGPANPLGERWIGFAHGDGWTIGIHGTPNPELLGRAVSRGCVRMRNADVIAIYERIQIGTPVVVEP
jgi:lipoprotein-anchoring transpeptidase ErfK/SrfK